MNRLPECLVVVDPLKEKNAIREARALGITTVSVIDSNCDPDMVDLPIPGNDDGIRSIELIMSHMADAVLAGKKNIVVKNEGQDSGGKQKKKTAETPEADSAEAVAEAEPVAEVAEEPPVAEAVSDQAS